MITLFTDNKKYKKSALNLHVNSVFIINFFFEILRSFLRKLLSTNNLATLIPPHLELYESKMKWQLIKQVPTVFCIFCQAMPLLFTWTKYKRKGKVSCPYIIDRIFDAVPTKDFTQVLSTVLNRLRFAIVQEIVVIWKLCLYRWQFVDFHLKLIILHSGWS
jgi:hypothetical protein